MKSSGRLWLGTQESHPEDEFNTCAFPWLSHPTGFTFMMTWDQAIFLALSLLSPCAPKLYSDVYVLESSENKGSHSSFSYAIKQTPFSVNVQPIGRLVVWKYWHSKAPVMGLTLMGNPPTPPALPCSISLPYKHRWLIILGHSTGIDELTLTKVHVIRTCTPFVTLPYWTA